MIPKTFSAPADETYANLKGYVPSPEDSARYAVWLMLMADDVNRRDMSYVPDEPERGVRISQGQPDYDPATLALILPCEIVQVAVSSGQFKYDTNRAGELDVTIGVALLEPASSAKIGNDVDAPPLTSETRLHRIRQILMRGTLYDTKATTRDGALVDPYRSPRKEDGTYDLDGPAIWLCTKGPDITPTRKTTFPNRRVRSDADLAALDPVRDFAVSYGWLARYSIIVANRDTMR